MGIYHSITTSWETGAADEELLDFTELVELLELLETPTPTGEELLEEELIDERWDETLDDTVPELLLGTDAATEA